MYGHALSPSRLAWSLWVGVFFIAVLLVVSLGRARSPNTASRPSSPDGRRGFVRAPASRAQRGDRKPRRPPAGRSRQGARGILGEPATSPAEGSREEREEE